MMNPRAQARRTLLIWLSGGLALALVLFAMANWPRATSTDSEGRLGELVVPGLGEALGEVSTITVSLADTGYTIIRSREGWVMLEAGRYPVRLDRLAELEQGLSGLTWGDAKTRDPEKYDRLGVGDPAEGGNGALVELLGPNQAVFASLIVGWRDDQLYVRADDEPAAWQVNGTLPPLLTREAWLDLDIVSMEPDAVGSVRLIAPDGNSVRLVRLDSDSEPGDQFGLAPPTGGRRLANRFAALGPALALTRLSPLDAKPVAALETTPVMRHITVTRDGLEITTDAYRDSDGGFITIRAVEAGQPTSRAESINARASGWAYRLTDFDWTDFATPIDEIVVAVAED